MKKMIVDIRKRTYKFALDVIRLTEEFPKTTASFIIQKQLIRSATSIGANLVEASYAASKKDFTNFYRYALKSAHETTYWLQLSKDLQLASSQKIEKLIAENIEIRKIIATIVIKTKS
ncbi:MAG: four helix bundle protein [Patescibacteria group bacterium]